MNKHLELEFSEFLIACINDNPDRMKKILFRMDYVQKEKLARSLVHALSVALCAVHPKTGEDLKEEFGFEIKVKEIANANISSS